MMYMTCNPYAERPFPEILIDNEPLTPNSSLARVENKTLQDSLHPSSGWKGFFQTIYSSLGIDRLTLKFYGSLEDFQLLKDAYNSFSKINVGMKVKFVIDLELATNISPSFRKNFLLNRLECLKKTKQELHSNNFDDTLKKCINLLNNEEMSNVEKILNCKSVLDGYFREHFQKDDEELHSHIKLLNKIRAEKFENGYQISLEEALVRHQFLVDFCVQLERVAPHIAQIISSEFEQINWPSPDISLAKTEIEGMEGYWLEETDDLIFEEKFCSAVRSAYNDFETTSRAIWSDEVWRHAESCYNYSDAYLNKWASRFHDCNVWFRVFFFCVDKTKCTVTNHVPAYWQGQKARQITRTYVEVVKYETDFLNAVQAAVSKQVEEFLPNVLSVSESWKEDLRDYQEILRRLEEAEEFSCQLEELREITERLTSIKCKTEERR